MRRMAVLAAVALVAGCSSGASHPKAAAPTLTPRSTAPATVSPTPTVPLCPPKYVPPDPNRPVVRLSFTLAADRASLAGTETVAFTPDRAVDDIVLRLWPNDPVTRKYGGRMRITRVQADGLSSYAVTTADTLLRIKLTQQVAANTTLHATVGFTFTLPVGASDRYGTRADATWWASGFPLLAYIRGEGYKTEAPTALFAETATSEEFRLADLAVTAPAGDTVIANGKQTSHRGNTWHFSADNVRDVGVASGHFRFAKTSAAGVPITVAVTRSLPDSATTIAGVIASGVTDHVARLGPFPYAQLNVPVVPDVHGGIEYPGLIYLGTHQLDATPSHEVAHEWFYGLVGDDQGRDPWLDEAFATYIEALHHDRGSYYAGASVPSKGVDKVGAPISYWEKYGEQTYFRSVYLQGATALRNARNAVGASKFDRAVRCYVNRSAHRVATPADLALALRDLPAAVDVLRESGALK
jgi:hypothetical protein